MKIPAPDSQTALRALRAMIAQRSVIAALEVFHQTLGNIFALNLPGFNAIMLVGPEAARFVLVEERDHLRWRSENDPIAQLLQTGILVTDGEPHDTMRRIMNPALHKQMLAGYIQAMWQSTDQIAHLWQPHQTYDMLVELRRIALLVLMTTLFDVDFTPDMERLWQAVLKTLQYISPGLWVVWPKAPRPGYARSLQAVDNYLYEIIQQRRAKQTDSSDLLGLLVNTPGLSSSAIRDQLLTMVIAGHDTVTAALSWALYLLGKHPSVLEQAQAEVDAVMGHEPPTMQHITNLRYLDCVINEALRLYPPAHVGSRIAAVDLDFQDYRIPVGTRVMYSIYLTQRMKEHWPDPARFNPDRFLPENGHLRAPYTFLPFGGGARTCIGLAYAQVETKVVLARLLQTHNFRLMREKFHLHMGATIEPRPGVIMTTTPR